MLQEQIDHEEYRKGRETLQYVIIAVEQRRKERYGLCILYEEK